MTSLEAVLTIASVNISIAATDHTSTQAVLTSTQAVPTSTQAIVRNDEAVVRNGKPIVRNGEVALKHQGAIAPSQRLESTAAKAFYKSRQPDPAHPYSALAQIPNRSQKLGRENTQPCAFHRAKTPAASAILVLSIFTTGLHQ